MWAQLDETLHVPETEEKVIQLVKSSKPELTRVKCPRSEMLCGRFEVRYIECIFTAQVTLWEFQRLWGVFSVLTVVPAIYKTENTAIADPEAARGHGCTLSCT